MKNPTKLMRFISIILLLVFISGQFLGSIAIKYYFLNSKIEELSPQLSSIASSIASGNMRDLHQSPFIIQAYNLYGKEIDLGNKLIHYDLHFIPQESDLLPLLPTLITGQNIALFRSLKGLPSKSIILGQPIIKNGTIIGGVFLLKPASDFRAALNGFNLVFFLTNFVGLSIILTTIYLYLQRMKDLECTRRNYISNISHELRTPISSIKALTEPLCDGLIQEEMTKERYYHIIYSECTRLERLISDMLELSKLQSGKMALQKSTIDPNHLIQKIERQFSILAEDIGIAFTITENAKTLPCVYTNENRILQVLNILIDNAIKFTPVDSKVTLDALLTDRFVKILIVDEGPGIPKEDLPLIFDRFYKGEKNYISKGSGLGLSIAKEIMDGLNEKIGVKSVLGKGSTFYFTMKRKMS